MRILLTGATGGIGSALAKAFAANGHAVLLQARNQGRLDALAADIGDSRNLSTISADITDANGRERICEAAARFAVDTLCNNAGINQFAAFDQTDIEKMINTNVTATMMLTQAMLPILLENQSPRVIVIGSAFGAIGFPGYTAYCASKFALKGFAESLAREYEPDNLSVHYFAPRATATSMNDDRVTQMNKEMGTATDTPDQVAKQVLAALKNNRPRLQLGATERLQTRLNALLPSVVDSALRGKLPIIKKYLSESHHVEANRCCPATLPANRS
ncbi:MAG: SDR family oxidoreductase [Congregibacter sp.]|nr:SDR family oxidoreductase [Congregibacter sp.]